MVHPEDANEAEAKVGGVGTDQDGTLVDQLRLHFRDVGQKLQVENQTQV